MRKTPYMIALVGLLISISLTLISLALPYWLYAPGPEDNRSVRYIDTGLYSRCERLWVHPNPKDPNGEVFREYRCEPFPSAAKCKENGQAFCVAWNTAGYASQLSLVFAAGALMTITLANITTKKRRRTAWKIVSSLAGVHGLLQIITMAIVAYLLNHYPHEFSPGTGFGSSFVINISSWVIDTIIAGGLVITGHYAHKGHRWAAGRRPYRPIPDPPIVVSAA